MNNYNTRNKDKLRPTVAKHAYRDQDFRLVGVHVWNYIAANLKIDTYFSTFKKTLTNLLYQKMFGLIWNDIYLLIIDLVIHNKINTSVIDIEVELDMECIHPAINWPMTYTVHTHPPDQRINKLYFFHCLSWCFVWIILYIFIFLYFFFLSCFHYILFTLSCLLFYIF